MGGHNWTTTKQIQFDHIFEAVPAFKLQPIESSFSEFGSNNAEELTP